MPSLEEQMQALTPMQHPEGYKGPTQEQAKSLLFGAKAEEAERDIETTVEQIGESKETAARKELAEQTKLEAKVEFITQHVGESLMKKLIEFSADPAFRSEAPTKQYTAAMETVLPVVFQELKAAYPDSDDNSLTGQIFHAYAKVLKEMGLSAEKMPQPEDLKAGELVMRSKKAGMSGEGIIAAEPGEAGEFDEVNRELGAIKTIPSTADFSKVAGTSAKPAPAMFRLSDLEKTGKKPDDTQKAA